jgi:hypothetical protein
VYKVCSTLYNFISPPQVDGINQVFTSFPKRINFEVNSPASQINRCVAADRSSEVREQRIAVGGATNGWKRVDYTVAIQLFHHSSNAEDAMDDFDKTVDNLKNRLCSITAPAILRERLRQGAVPRYMFHNGYPCRKKAIQQKLGQPCDSM